MMRLISSSVREGGKYAMEGWQLSRKKKSILWSREITELARGEMKISADG